MFFKDNNTEKKRDVVLSDWVAYSFVDRIYVKHPFLFESMIQMGLFDLSLFAWSLNWNSVGKEDTEIRWLCEHEYSFFVLQTIET